MFSKRLIWLLTALMLVFWSCRKSPVSSFEIFRIIDHLESGNIARSPLPRVLENSDDPGVFYPLRSFPLKDLGTGENPFDLKRKLRMGGTEFNILFAPSDSEYSIECEVPENSALVFGTGLIRDKNSENLLRPDEQKRGVNFQVFLESDGRRKTLFQKYVSLPPRKVVRTIDFTSHTIHIPNGIKKARLIFKTEGLKWGFSFWFNPVLYRKNSSDLNVILISVDTLRADHLGCYGYGRETSPSIDALARESARFENVYATSSWTLPSHVSMLSGLFGVHHQVYYDSDKMDPELITLADILRNNNFFCSAFTGAGFVSSIYGFSKGFDTYEEGSGGVFKQDSAEFLFRVASEWIDNNKDKNFFLFLHTYQPHGPYACPYPYKAMFLDEGAEWGHIDLLKHLGGKPGIFKPLPEDQRRNVVALYDAEIRYTDEKLVGPLISKLKDMGLYEKTLLIFTSDHGEEFFDHRGWAHGHNLYAESLKVPLIIKFPDGQYGGKVFENIISQVDLMPTILEVLGLSFTDYSLDGKSLIPVLKGKEQGDREFLADLAGNLLNSHVPQKFSHNRGKTKLILNKKFSAEDISFFDVPPPETEPVEVYDLGKDPLEKTNIVHQIPALVNEILEYIKSTYEKAEKRKTGKAEIDEDLREQLRALGYIK